MAPERRIGPTGDVRHIRSELLDRLASPLYAFVGGLIAFAALGEARTTRQGRGIAIGGRFSRSRRAHARHCGDDPLVGVPSASVFVWAIPVAACLGALALIFRRRSSAPPGRRKDAGVIGRTLSFYLADRFARSVIAAFMVVFVLIYAVDLVELLRRSGDSQRATGILWPACRSCEPRRSPNRRCRSRFCSGR